MRQAALNKILSASCDAAFAALEAQDLLVQRIEEILVDLIEEGENIMPHDITELVNEGASAKDDLKMKVE